MPGAGVVCYPSAVARCAVASGEGPPEVDHTRAYGPRVSLLELAQRAREGWDVGGTFGPADGFVGEVYDVLITAFAPDAGRDDLPLHYVFRRGLRRRSAELKAADRDSQLIVAALTDELFWLALVSGHLPPGVPER